LETLPLCREFWDDEGWAWRQHAGADHPIYWKKDGGGDWMRRDFNKFVSLEPQLPMIHVNWYEAEAWCRWGGRRLPTEAEWEMAASYAPELTAGSTAKRRRYPWGEEPPTLDRANLDWNASGTVNTTALPNGASAFGCRHLLGNVWEWTSSDFVPYPGFTPDSYREYSQPWFYTHKVLRGGCWATRSSGLSTLSLLVVDRCRCGRWLVGIAAQVFRVETTEFYASVSRCELSIYLAVNLVA
jgi:iron(II)-dependent oxidoreductase